MFTAECQAKRAKCGPHRVIVNVTNSLEYNGTSVHWHVSIAFLVSYHMLGATRAGFIILCNF